MFTGIVDHVGKIVSVEERRGQTKLLVRTKWNDLVLGESVALNGVCLTVSEIQKQDVQFFVSEETAERTGLDKIPAETTVNLERSLTLQSRLGGHWVQGHVDTKGLVLNITDCGDAHRVNVALDPKYGRYCVEKGSIALDGISLTINSFIETKLNEFMINLMIVPFTWKNTTISTWKSDTLVNVEVDILAKYIERLCPPNTKQLWNNFAGVNQ